MVAQELFALSVALPIAWLHMDANVESSRARKHERVKELVSLSKSRAHFLAFCVWSFFSFKQVVGRTGTKEGRKAGRKAGRREGRKEGKRD